MAGLEAYLIILVSFGVFFEIFRPAPMKAIGTLDLIMESFTDLISSLSSLASRAFSSQYFFLSICGVDFCSDEAEVNLGAEWMCLRYSSLVPTLVTQIGGEGEEEGEGWKGKGGGKGGESGEDSLRNDLVGRYSNDSK